MKLFQTQKITTYLDIAQLVLAQVYSEFYLMRTTSQFFKNLCPQPELAEYFRCIPNKYH